MRKRRVLALLLALSLVVSGNGMTVLAAEQGTDVSVFAAEEMTDGTPSETEEDEDDTLGGADETPETEDKEDKSEENEPETEGDGSPEEDKTDGDEATENPENPDENDPSAPKEDDTEQGNDQPADENGDQADKEDGDQSSVEDGEQVEEQEPAVDAEEPSVSENDLDETETPEEEIEEKPGEVRMMSFTDASGLQITFDAVAAERNAEKVTINEDGVLIGIDDSAEGVVDLRKQEISAIGDSAFEGKAKITYVMLPKTVKSIGSSAFMGCAVLKGVSIPSRLETIGDSAFKDCKALTQMAIPNSVVSIGANAFNGDNRLFMLNMVSASHSKLESIGNSAFEGCVSLEMFCSDEEYDLPSSLKAIGNRAFYGCVCIDEVDMEDNITFLGEAAYQSCIGIKEVTISASLVNISAKAFADCTELLDIEFSTAVNGATTIESYAFENCRRLSSINLPQREKLIVKSDAFKGCGELKRIYIEDRYATLEDAAFPNENEDLCIIGFDNSTAHDYADNNGRLRFIAIDDKERKDYYRYTQKLTGPTANGTIQIKVTNVKNFGTDFSKIKDINDIVNNDAVGDYNRGVKAGEDCYVVIYYGAGDNNWYGKINLVPGSLKCNGEEIKSENGVPHFTMPVGGAAVTAEFEYANSESTVLGNKETIEGRLSSDVNYDYERNVAYMKIGQSAKFYLTNSYGGAETRIPASKIKYSIDKNLKQDVVSVEKEGNKKGTVKALKEGTARVQATVQTEGGDVTVGVTIVVEKTGIDHISVSLPDAYKDRNLTVENDLKGVSGVSIPTTSVTRDYKIDIKAAAFSSVEDDEEMEVAFTWTSSDTKVAKLEKASTTPSASENKIIIPKGASGEATITVSATGLDKKKVTRKFVVSAQSYEPRLNATKITVNPNQKESTTTIGIIDAYGKAVDNNKIIEAFDQDGFTFKFLEKQGVVSTYQVSALKGMQQKSYNVNLKVTVQGIVKPYELPLTIVIKESFPNPTVTFDKKADKINLFLANDGVEIKPVIGKLGDNVVSKYKLAPLTEEGDKNHNKDNLLFTENFQIDENSGVITQKAPNLKKSNEGKGKPVLTGYLVLMFEGYGDLEKKYKITIPTTTVAPSYVLERTTDTFGGDLGTEQIITLLLLDKKTKKPIMWDDGFTNGLTADTDKTTFQFTEPKLVSVDQKVDGKNQKCVGIQVHIKPAAARSGSGKLVMKVRNSKWAEGKEFSYTYNIKIDNKPQKLSLKKATITLNANYPEREETFTLVSNHRDVKLTEEQKFEPQPTKKNVDGFQKLSVICKDGEGTVSLKSGGKDIAAGSYKYVYTYEEAGKDNKVTLTVKVNKAAPTVALKGSNAFNLQAKDGETYVEVSEMTMTVKNLPNTQKYLETEEAETRAQSNSDENQGGGEGTGSGDNIGDGSQGGDSTGGGSQGGDGTGGGDNPGGDQGGDTPGGEPVEQPKQINEEFYRLDTEQTFGSIEITTKKYAALKVSDYFRFEWVEDENGAGGKLRISLKKAMDTTTYTLRMTPTYKNRKDGKENVIKTAKPVSFKIKVYSSIISSVKLSAKGKINLLDRRPQGTKPDDFEYTEKNGIRYTPTVANLKDTLQEVRLLDNYPDLSDYADETKLSTLFEARITEDKKSFYIVPKEGVELKNKETYKVYAWLLMDGYKFGADTGNGIYTPTPIKVKTAEILPKVKMDQTTTNLYMSSKAYEATFIVQKSDEKAIGAIENIAFGEKDEKANESFEVYGVKRDDGSLEVHLKLKNAVDYKCNSTNKIKMYIQFTGQGTNTAGTPITMNVKINK